MGITVFDTEFGPVAVRPPHLGCGRYLDRILSLTGIQMVIIPLDHAGDLREIASSSAENALYSVCIIKNRDKDDYEYHVFDGTGAPVFRTDSGERRVVSCNINFGASLPWLTLHPGFRFPGRWEYPDRWLSSQRPAVHGGLHTAANTMRRPELYGIR